MFDRHERGTYDGEYADEFRGIDMQDDTHVRRRAKASVNEGKMNAKTMNHALQLSGV